MSDLFQEDVPDAFIESVVKVMVAANWHAYQVLTKRSARMRQFLGRHENGEAKQLHIWWGVSVEDRKHGLPRIDDLRQTPASNRFLSIEPLLEDLGTLDLTGIDWVIVGGESGRRARPMRPEWVVSVRDQCEEAGVPFFFKQWGGVQKKQAGRELEGNLYDASPVRVATAGVSKSHARSIIAGLDLDAVQC